MLSGTKSLKPLNGASDHMGRTAIKSQRPTALLTCRNRSESPSTRSKSRPSDQSCVSPPSDQKLDLDSLQRELELKSGVLNFGSETFVARMDDFINESLLGSGTCSSVYRMRHYARPDLVMAVKHMRRSSTCQEENKRILMDLNVVCKSNDCPFIVQCFGIFFTTGDVWICMEVMATCLDKLLRDLERPFPERVIGKVTVSIITALDFLKQKHNIMHRDVKPSNMLLSFNGVIKLCDFGISGKLKDSIARSRQLGCIGYMAPERLETPTYDVRADIWSLGISLVELATGSFPYKGTEIEFAIMSKIISDPAPTLPHHIPFTSGFRHFIELCLQKDHRQRPKYRSLMSTEFFSRYNVFPFDVLDWVKGLPLKHLHRSDDNVADAASSSAMSSPNSNKTLSPELGRNLLHDLSLDTSIELNRSIVMEEPRLVPRDVILRHNGSSNALCESPSAVRSTGDESAVRLNQLDYTSGSCFARNHVAETGSCSSGLTPTTKLAPFRETPSLASSGYGSVGSNDDSPNSWSSGNHRVVGGRVVPDPPQASKWNQPHAKLLAAPSDSLASKKKTEQWISTASSSLITKHIPLPLSDNPSSLSPRDSPKPFYPVNGSTTLPISKCPGFSNRIGYFGTVGCAPRSFTPPMESMPSATDPCSQTTQLRSSSVGPQLHRSVAQRWPCKPQSGSPHSSSPVQPPQPADPRSIPSRLPAVTDHRRPAPAKDDRNPQPTPPPVPPHRSRPYQKNFPNHQPPTTAIRYHPMAEDTSAEVHPSPPHLTGLRLTHRLHTHPIPRQINTSPANSVNHGNARTPSIAPLRNPAPDSVPNGCPDKLEDPSRLAEMKRHLKPPKPLRPSSRSISQPALPRVPSSWRSFETDL